VELRRERSPHRPYALATTLARQPSVRPLRVVVSKTSPYNLDRC